MYLTIHRGTKQIGGSCVELQANDGARIILDIGMPLAMPDGADWPAGTMRRSTEDLRRDGVLPAVDGLYRGDRPDVAAVFLSHAHLDHHGLAPFIHPDIPVHASPGTIAMLEVSGLFLPSATQPGNIVTLPLPPAAVQLGPFRVQAIPVDHAAPDSRALLVEADGERVLYSGDLRAHGRLRHLFDELPAAAGHVDVLVLEGTTMGQESGSHGIADELALEAQLSELLRATDQFVLVAASGQNIDRAVSVYRAALAADRQFVMDLYQAYVMDRLRELRPDAPQFDSPGVRIKFIGTHVTRMKEAGHWGLVCRMARRAKVRSEELFADPGGFAYLARSNAATVGLLRYLESARPSVVVWSQWGGYLDKGGAIADWCLECGREPLRIHSGGHATPGDLAVLAGKIGARVVVPVHTFAPAEFGSRMVSAVMMDDGCAVAVTELCRRGAAI